MGLREDAGAHFRRRWGAWTAVLVVSGLVSLPFWIRARGRAALEDVFARHRAAGIGSAPEDLLPGAPPVDAGVQRRWSALVGSLVNNDIPVARNEVQQWIAEGRRGPLPEKAASLRESTRRTRETALSLLSEGPPVAGALGHWIAAGSPPIRDPGAGIQVDSLLGAKVLFAAFGLETLLADDPRPSLAAMDGIVRSFDRPATIIDGMIGLALEDDRDRTHAFLAWAGTLPREHGDRWLAEEPREPLRVAEAFRGERLLFLGPLARGLADGRLDAGALFDPGGGSSRFPFPWPGGRSSGPGGWLYGTAACARVLDHYAKVEEALRAGRALPVLDTGDSAAGDLAGTIGANTAAATISSLQHRQRGRALRIFVRIVRMAEETGSPPVDEADLRARLGKDACLLDAGPLDMRLLFERPAPGRVRVRVDEAGPIPPLLRGCDFWGVAPDPKKPLPPIDLRFLAPEGRVPR